MMRDVDRISAADAERRSAPLADAVQCENRRLVAGARKKRTRRVTLVMIEKQNGRGTSQW